MGVLRWALIVVAGALASGCLYYDSRWGQATAEQKHHAARLQPASVQAPREHGEVLRRSATVRACATAAYSSETLGWEARFDELLRNANSVLEPAIGLRVTSAGTTLWKPAHGEGGLSEVIGDLPSCEGRDADWVVAFVQSTPKVVTDFHVLGMGQTFSPYLAMRAPNDPAELAALTLALPDLAEATRQKLYSDRKRHKTLTLFLHELAHTLGAVHRTAKNTIMSPTYDASEGAYDDATLALLRFGLEIRLDRVSRYAEARKLLEAAPTGFVESERVGQVAFLRQWEQRAPRGGAPLSASAPAASATVVAEPPARVEPVAFETLSKEDRQTFNEALKLEPTSPRDAWTLASPLFEAHPAVRAVQELRCRLAKARKFYEGVIEAHCARLAALGP